MNNLIKKSQKAFKEGGIKLFFQRVKKYLYEKIPLFSHRLYFLLFKNKIINKVKNFQTNNIGEVWNFINNRLCGLIKPMQIKEEFTELLKIYVEKQPKIFLEIGTANGGTLFSFCKLAPEDAILISIDLPKGKFGGGYPDWKIPLYQAFKKENQQLYLLREDSHNIETLNKVKDILNDRNIDFLFIDADHTYEGVKKDFEMYSPLVAKEGIIAFHDIVKYPPELGCNVDKFWDEIKKEFQFKEIIKDKNQMAYGIGVVFKK
jgi:predicted O-methyltransferase YrrM